MIKKPNVGMLIGKLRLTPENVVAEAAENPALFHDAVEYRIGCMHNKNEAEMALDAEKADVSMRIRHNARSVGEKTTEASIDALITRSPRVQKKTRILHDREEMDEYSKLLVEAFRMRRDCLEVIGGMMRSELASQKAMQVASAELADARRKLQAKYPGRTEGL